MFDLFKAFLSRVSGLGAEVHIRNEENLNYPLHLAAQNGEKDMLRIIYDTAKQQTKKSDTEISNVTNKKLETPLHRAALFNRTEAVKFLLEQLVFYQYSSRR